MERRPSRKILPVAAAAAAAAAIAVRHRRHAGGAAHHAPGGVLIGDTRIYDRFSRLALGRFFSGIAADVAAIAAVGARVLEVGCGPGHLTLRLAEDHGLEVVGTDLDPAMIDRARRNAGASASPTTRAPLFEVADVGALPFRDGSFDLVVSTLSLHHWSDPTAGLAEIARVLRGDGRALIWDLRPGGALHPQGPHHGGVPDPADHLHGTGLEVVRAGPWRWPLRLALTRRVELRHAEG